MLLNELNIKQAHQGLIEKKFSALELFEACRKKIEDANSKINAFLLKTYESGEAAAKEIDKKIKANENIGLLAGIPVVIKDNILVQGIVTTAASQILENYIASYDATVITKLKQEGYVMMGKTNMDEFAMGGSTENSSFQKTYNPHDLERVPGGSSGGSAAALSSNMCLYALGSDTGGSIRQPAAFCGVVGLKPTYGTVSRHGLIAMGSSLDQIGPFSKTVSDSKIIFQAIKGKDSHDSTSLDFPERLNAVNKKNKLTIGIPKEYFIDGMDPTVDKTIRNAIQEFEKLGYNIKKINLPHTEYALAVYYIIVAAEVSANMSRYDGIRYGYSKRSDANGKSLGFNDIYCQSREIGLGSEVKRRIMLGTYILSAGYYDAFYLKAQKVRSLLKQDFDKAFETVDCILTPTCPTVAFKIGEKINDPLTMYLSDIFTVAVNIVGLPAMSMPCGFIDVDNKKLPVGLQLIGPQFGETILFEIGSHYETQHDSK